jgi:hypothetical protein
MFRTLPCVVIHAPHWFRRADFQEYRKDPMVATWHGDEGYEDVFLYFPGPEFMEEGEGSVLPRDIALEIKHAVNETLGDELEAVVWIQSA